MPFIVGSLIGGGVSLLGAGLSSNATKDAAGDQKQGAKDANQLAAGQYDQTVARNAPFTSAGVGALAELTKRLGIGGAAYSGPGVDDINAQLAQLSADPANYQEGAAGDAVRNQIRALQAQLPNAQAAATATANQASPEYGSLLKPFTGADLTSTPRYQLGLTQGTNALTNSLAAKGGLYSGAAGKAMQKFGQDYANTQFDTGYGQDLTNRQFTQNALLGVTGIGQSSANNTSVAGQNYAQLAGGNILGAANASAAGTIGSANAFSSGISNALGSYQQSQLLQQLLKQNALASNASGYGAANTPSNPNAFF